MSTPQDNAGIFIGQINISGFDSHSKLNLGHGALFGILGWSIGHRNLTHDGHEFIDGVIFDQDMKMQISMNF